MFLIETKRREELLRELHTKETGSIRWERTSKSWSHTLEERTGTFFLHEHLVAVRDTAVRAFWSSLDARLEHISRDGNGPIDNTSETTGDEHAERRRFLAFWSQTTLNGFETAKVADRADRIKNTHTKSATGQHSSSLGIRALFVHD